MSHSPTPEPGAKGIPAHQGRGAAVHQNHTEAIRAQGLKLRAAAGGGMNMWELTRCPHGSHGQPCVGPEITGASFPVSVWM